MERRYWFLGFGVLVLVSITVLISESRLMMFQQYNTPSQNSTLRTPPPPPDEDPWITKEKCYSLADESEFCVYEGPLCISSDRGDVYVSSASGAQEEDERLMASCTDFRFWESQEKCRGYHGPWYRENTPRDGIIQRIQDREIPGIVTDKRSWGPDARQVQISDISRNVLVKAFLNSLSLNHTSYLPSSWVEAALKTPKEEIDILPAPGVALPSKPRSRRNPAVMPERVSWLNETMYVLPLAQAWDQHLWHFSSAAMQIFAIKRENMSADTRAYAPRGRGHFPSIDYLAIPGEYQPLENITYGFASWIRMLTPFFTQSHTKVLTNGKLHREFGANKTHWLCAPRGVLPGLKPRFFTGISDAYAFRAAAYAMANVSRLAWPHWPPRKITVLDRRGASRWFYNRDLLEEVLNSTGLPYEVVSFSAWEDGRKQITKMAETGILICAHGNAGTNAMFLPAHSVFIEVYPYLWLNPAFKNLGLVSDVHHIAVFSKKPTEEQMARDPQIEKLFPLILTPEFKQLCEDNNLDWLDSNLSVCNGWIKNSPIMLPIQELKVAINDALLMIGCRNGYCGCGFGNNPHCEKFPRDPSPSPSSSS